MAEEKSLSPLGRAWKKFRKNIPAMTGMGFILFVALVSVLGTFIRPDQTTNANSQNLNISRQSPGFSCTVLSVPIDPNKEEMSPFEAWLNGGYPITFKEYPLEEFWLENDAIGILSYGTNDSLLISYDSFFAENGSLPKIEAIQHIQKEHIQSRRFLLGTDKYGRDLLSRLMAGAFISLMVGFIAVLISLLIGVSLGALAGYYGGKTDKIIMWFINVIWSVPTLLLVIAITFAFGKGFWKVFIAVGLTMWVEVARVVRGQFLSLREKEYVEAGKVLGYSGTRIIFRHLLPNAVGPIIVISAANFAAAILIEAGLSFLGIGAQIPVPSWGNMIKEHYNLITTDLAYLAFIPGICIMLLVLAFMLVGNGLRDALDVRS